MTGTLAPLDPARLAPLRPELAGYCYRMLGSAFEADDAVQETMLRAWRLGASYEGRGSVRAWVYRIATNVCLDLLRQRGRRAVPMDLGPASPVAELAHAAFGPVDRPWLTPVPAGGDPGEAVVERESVRLAFVAALQHLPARQRAALILRDVLSWRTAEVAALLDVSGPAVDSLLQRARATLAARDATAATAPPLGGDDHRLLARYVDAFERYDIDALVSLLRDDAVQSMPPFPQWLRGATEIGAFLRGPGAGCAGSRLLPTAANGHPAFGQYRPDGHGGHRPWSLQVLELSGGRIAGLHCFLDTALFPMFGLPTDGFPGGGQSGLHGYESA